jgi:hypothetical protein
LQALPTSCPAKRSPSPLFDPFGSRPTTTTTTTTTTTIIIIIIIIIIITIATAAN